MITLVGGVKYAGWAGMIYPILLCPAFTIIGALGGRRRRYLQQSMRSESAVL
jgi:hypothetical protein